MRSISFSTESFLWLFGPVFNYTVMLQAVQNHRKLTLDEEDLRLTVLDVVVVGGVTHWWVSAHNISVQVLNQAVFHVAKMIFFGKPTLPCAHKTLMLAQGSASIRSWSYNTFYEHVLIAIQFNLLSGKSLNGLQSTTCSTFRNVIHHANQSLCVQHTPHSKSRHRPFMASYAYHLSALG